MSSIQRAPKNPSDIVSDSWGFFILTKSSARPTRWHVPSRIQPCALHRHPLPVSATVPTLQSTLTGLPASLQCHRDSNRHRTHAHDCPLSRRSVPDSPSEAHTDTRLSSGTPEPHARWLTFSLPAPYIVHSIRNPRCLKSPIPTHRSTPPQSPHHFPGCTHRPLHCPASLLPPVSERHDIVFTLCPSGGTVS